MISVDLKGKSVLVTGGTKGIGRAIGMQFAKAGAKVYLTYRWGSADPAEIAAAFVAAGGQPPVMIEADASVSEETDRLLGEIAKSEKAVDIFISNVGISMKVPTLDDYKKSSLFKTIEYSSWPIVEYTQKIKKTFGRYPKYVLGISSDGPDHYYKGYDFVAASKALLELFVKQLSMHLFPEGSRVNVLRFGAVKTDAFDIVFGNEFFDWATKNGVSEEMILSTEECGKAALGLCSGLLDGINGQIITVDFGMALRSNLLMQYITSKHTTSRSTNES
jgi:NAD(P)-dependent dehydrogenase (short-subunit alcohol dehydrogenase family)